ncbi:ABC transporter ATP-binding protein [Lachnotalea glycerini]|uniref:ABC transporter ATP-binding protein n=1 Tax=Lachnotalea glycerini TaxID=1763509 RepID=A0A371JEK6_9FIRM|nr:ABC transporter ATP-binding protein [Lachnotalea glycerini]RDY31172.1 ABC transporter ATP-binding protein [Lachnotalea glycerini]
MKEGIIVESVFKKYGDINALNDINIKLEYGTIYGILGRNGAGKSTLINIISNRIFSDKGRVSLNGISVRENDLALQDIYVMSEQKYYPPKMKVKDLIYWTKKFYPSFDLEYSKEISSLFDLNWNKTVESLSTGYSSILKIVITLSINVPFVFLDEPVLGLDINHRDLFYKSLMKRFKDCKNTFVISTHLIEELSDIIEKVILIKQGKVLIDESKDTLLERARKVTGSKEIIANYIKNEDIIATENSGDIYKAYLLTNTDYSDIKDITIEKLGLQELFLKLTN